MILTAVKIILSVLFIVDYTETYSKVLRYLHLDFKPFNCSLCMVFWVSVITTIMSYPSLDLCFPFMTGMIYIIVSRLISLLPITFN